MAEVDLHGAVVIPLLKKQGANHVEYVHGTNIFHEKRTELAW